MLLPELDVLRNKELSFWCIVECEWSFDIIISKHVNRTNWYLTI